MDEAGNVVGVAASEYSYETPHPLWSEQSPILWWHATIESIRGALAKTGIDPAQVKVIGLTVRHSLAHLTRSVLEGVSFGLRDSFELMKSSGLKNAAQVRVTGGGARSPLWRQILADILQAEVVTVNTTEGAATGAGVFPNVESACDATIQITGSVNPGKNSPEYDRLYPLYRGLYPALKQTFANLGI